MSNLKDFVQNNTNPIGPALPLIHSTVGYHFRNITPGDELIPVRCRHFKADLTYLFYGKPAYKPPSGVNSNLMFNWPVVMIFKSQDIPIIDRIYPFDTGAFEMDIYKGFFHKDTNLGQFEMPGDLDFARRIAELFFTDVTKYITGYADRNVPVSDFDFELQGLQELYRVESAKNSGDEVRRDERSTTIEIQISQPINLPDALYALIVPQQFMDEASVQNAIARWNPDIMRFYTPKMHLGDSAVSGEIYALVEDIYRNELKIIP